MCVQKSRKISYLKLYIIKFLFRRQALLCVLADNCDEPMYKKLVQALCNEHQIPLIKVDNNKKLGEWAGLCKIDNTGKARKVVGCSCVVVKVSYFGIKIEDINYHGLFSYISVFKDQKC